MIFDYSLAGLVSAGLLFYLTYALLRPERFLSRCSAAPNGASIDYAHSKGTRQ